MKSKLSRWIVCTLLMLALVPIAATGAQEGQSKLSVINYVGRPMAFTINGAEYVVPGTDTEPDGGRLTIPLMPGRYVYSAQVPGAEGTNGEILLSVGQSDVLGARLERTSPIFSLAGLVLEEPKDQLVFFEASLAPVVSTHVSVPVTLQPIPPGKGALVFVNYIGEDVIVDISGQLYTVPTNGRLQVNLSPGQVSFSASSGLSGTNGSTDVVVDKYVGLGMTREIGPEELDYELGKPAPTRVPLQMNVFPVALDDNVPLGHASPSAPSTIAREPAEPSPAVAVGQSGLVIVNFIGEVLTFTIDDHAYEVTQNGGDALLGLAPGEYTFTASTPRASTNGSLRVIAAQFTRVNVALDLGSGQIILYIE